MTVPDDNAVVDWLSRGDLGGGFPPPPRAVTIDRSNRNPSSSTWTARIGPAEAAARRVFVKHHREAVMYRREKRALDRLRPYSLTTEKYAVPELLAWSDENRLLALPWMEPNPVGPGLRAAVGRNRSSRQLEIGAADAFEIGQWLRHFEKRTATSQVGPFPRDLVISRVEELNRLIRDRKIGGFDGQLVAAIEAEVTRTVDRTHGRYEYCLIHRDFWFDHIWKTVQGILVIDFGRCIEGPPGRDATQFHLRLVDFPLFNPMISTRRVRRLTEEFTRGYGSFDPRMPHIRAYTILCKLEQLAGIVEQPQGGAVVSALHGLHARAHVRWLRKSV